MDAGITSVGGPSALLVEFTSHCNLKCSMCPLTARRCASGLLPGHVSEDVWKRIVEFARGVEVVTVAGYGEPLMNPKCVAYLRELDDLGIATSLTTNGTLVTDRLAEEMASLRHLTAVQVSIDSPDPDVYRRVRGGNVRKACDGARRLAHALDPWKVSVTSVLMRTTLDSLIPFPRLLAELGVKKYVLQGLIDYTTGLDEEELRWRSDLPERVEEIRQACRDAGVELTLALPDRVASLLDEPGRAGRAPAPAPAEHATKVCGAPWEGPVVDKDGRVFPCCYALTNQAALLGDLRDESGEQVWAGGRYERFRRDLLDGRTTPDICRSCTVVPTGPHPFAAYAAEILAEESRLSGGTTRTLRVRNIGASTWTRADRVLVGTAAPRDHASALWHPCWIGNNRITSFSEESVPSGEVATFTFEVAPTAAAAEAFQLVVENQCWMPNTRFLIEPAPPLSHGRAARLMRRLIGH